MHLSKNGPIKSMLLQKIGPSKGMCGAKNYPADGMDFGNMCLLYGSAPPNPGHK